MVFLVNLPERPLAMLNLESDNDGKRLKTAGDSLCTDVAPSSEKIGRGSPEVQKKNSRKGKLNEKKFLHAT